MKRLVLANSRLSLASDDLLDFGGLVIIFSPATDALSKFEIILTHVHVFLSYTPWQAWLLNLLL